MAIQNVNTTVDTSASAPADLSTLQDTRISDGYRVWVTQAGVSHGLWVLDQNSVAVPDGSTVVATLSGVGRWILFGAGGGGGGGGIVSVNTEALLTAVGVSASPDGEFAYVGNPLDGPGQSQDSTWQLITQVAGIPALAAHEVIASSVAGRVWQRLLGIQTPRWSQQIAWGIDSVNGNDENIGSVASPLQTQREFFRRVPAPSVDMTITVAAGSSFAATDPTVYQPIDRQNQANSILLTFIGARSRTALPNVVTSTNVVLATGTSPTIDVGAVLAVASIIEATATGNTAVVLFLIAGTNYATSEWSDANGANQVPPVAGSAMATLTFPTTPLLGITAGHIRCLVQNMNITKVDPSLNRGVTVRQCIFPAFVANDGGGGGGTATGNAAPARYTFEGCSITGSGTNFAFIGTYLAVIYLSGCFGKLVGQLGAKIDIRRSFVTPASTIGIDIQDSAECYGFNIGVGNTTAAAIDLHAGGRMRLFAAGLYGLAALNTGKGTKVREGSQFLNVTGSTPTLFATGQELELDNAATANGPPPLGTGIIPIAVALTTWVQLQAAPFNGSVLSYSTGASILLTNP